MTQTFDNRALLPLIALLLHLLARSRVSHEGIPVLFCFIQAVISPPPAGLPRRSGKFSGEQVVRDFSLAHGACKWDRADLRSRFTMRESAYVFAGLHPNLRSGDARSPGAGGRFGAPTLPDHRDFVWQSTAATGRGYRMRLRFLRTMPSAQDRRQARNPIERQNVEPGISNFEGLNFMIGHSWFDILPFKRYTQKTSIGSNTYHLTPSP